MLIGRGILVAAALGAATWCASAAPLASRSGASNVNDANSPPANAPSPSVRVAPPAPQPPPPPPPPTSVEHRPPAPQPPTTPTPTLPTPTPPPADPGHDHHHHDGDHHDHDHGNGGRTIVVTPGGFGGGGFIPYGPMDTGVDQPQLPPPPPADIGVTAPKLPAVPPAPDPISAAADVLARVRAALRTAFETSPSYQAALDGRRDAKAAAGAAVARARANLAARPEYRDALAARDRAAAAVKRAQLDERQRLAEASDSPAAPTTLPVDTGLLRAAQAKLTAAAKLGEIERRLLDDDKDVGTARDRLAAAEQHVHDLEQAFAAKADQDPAVLQAQRRLDAARLAAAAGPQAPVPAAPAE